MSSEKSPKLNQHLKKMVAEAKEKLANANAYLEKTPSSENFKNEASLIKTPDSYFSNLNPSNAIAASKTWAGYKLIFFRRDAEKRPVGYLARFDSSCQFLSLQTEGTESDYCQSETLMKVMK